MVVGGSLDGRNFSVVVCAGARRGVFKRDWEHIHKSEYYEDV